MNPIYKSGTIILWGTVTQEPKLLGAQLPYESDPFEPGNLFYVQSRGQGKYT